MKLVCTAHCTLVLDTLFGGKENNLNPPKFNSKGFHFFLFNVNELVCKNPGHF